MRPGEPVEEGHLRDQCEDCGLPRLKRQSGDQEEPDLAKLFTCQPCGAGAGGSSGAPFPGTAVVYDARMLAHAKEERESVHPERPDRLRAIRQHLEACGLWQRCEVMAAREATAAELELVHTPAHCRTVKEHCEQAKDFRSDTYAVEASWEAALLSCGSVAEMAIAVADGRYRNGYAVVRPPGHHAEPPHALHSAAAIAPPRGAEELIAAGRMPWADTCCGSMGFCLFNNVAVAARAAQREVASCNKVLIVDWDVHHGNGTQTAFIDDPSVLYFSPHRFDEGKFYPGGPAGGPEQVGIGKGAGFNINIGWPHGGMGDAEYAAAWYSVLLPCATQFQPDLVLVSAGFDAADGDPLGGCAISPGGYAMMTSLMMGLAGGKLVIALEGGYNLRSISQSSAACVATLLGDPVAPGLELPRASITLPMPTPVPSHESRKVLGPTKGARWAIRKTVSAHAKYWTLLCAQEDDDDFDPKGGGSGDDQEADSTSASDSDSETGPAATTGSSADDGEAPDSIREKSAPEGAQQSQRPESAQREQSPQREYASEDVDDEEEHVIVHGRAGKRPRTDGTSSDGVGTSNT
jgi:acetoin utilization deacetylase AcuC-like enzyme